MSADEARERLRQLLVASVVRPQAGQPIEQAGGRPAAWLFSTWLTTLTGEGLALAAECTLAALEASFRGTQLATCGSGGLPLMSACVAAGRGHHGLFVRRERKAYGSVRRIEGPLDERAPVVVIDDTLGTGRSALEAIEALEAEGLEVEGVLALVHFAGFGGARRLEALGYRFAAVFDARRDLELPAPEPADTAARADPAAWGEDRVPDGLHAAVAARYVARSWLAHGVMPRPPASFDRSIDGRGGVYVSFRERDSDLRVHRDGFWHFDPSTAAPTRDLVVATVKTIEGSGGRVTTQILDALKIAVSWCGALEEVPIGGLDFGQHGVVVTTLDRTRIGGALPNTQYFSDTVEQLRHARSTNARIGPTEPHRIYRHTVDKQVEPGESWLPFGAPEGEALAWTHDPAIGGALLRRVWECLRGVCASGVPLDPDLAGSEVYGVGVTLHRRGALGCGVAWGAALDDCVQAAARGALEDPRYEALEDLDGVRATVSILHDREWIGELPLVHVAPKLRRGLDSLAAISLDGERNGLLLPSVAIHHDWSEERTARELLVKAGITSEPCQWALFPTASWLGGSDGETRELRFAFPVRAASHREDAIRRVASFIARQCDAQTGMPAPAIELSSGACHPPEGAEASRAIHSLWALHRAGHALSEPGWSEAARRGLAFCARHVSPTDGALALPRRRRSAMAESLLLAAVHDGGGDRSIGEVLTRRLRGWRRPDGRITELPRSRGITVDHDHLPGAVVMALAMVGALEQPEPVLAWYRRRFRIATPWPLVGWQMLGWSAAADPAGTRFVFELADWACDRQHGPSGAFVADIASGASGPGLRGFGIFTAFVAEGLGAVRALAQREGDQRRAERYRESCERAADFVERLVVAPEDTYWMADPPAVVGAVRGAPASVAARIDFAGHALMALLAAAQ